MDVCLFCCSECDETVWGLLLFESGKFEKIVKIM